MLRRIVGLVLLCFVVGLVLATLGVSPRSIFTDTWRTLRSVADLLLSFTSWAMPYILLGASIVVPIALIGVVIRVVRGRG